MKRSVDVDALVLAARNLRKAAVDYANGNVIYINGVRSPNQLADAVDAVDKVLPKEGVKALRARAEGR